MTIHVPTIFVVFFVILSSLAVTLGFAYLFMLEWNLARRRVPQHDDLTGLYTRGTIRNHICHRLSHVSRLHRAELTARSSDAFILLDLDCFKHVNDTCGHPSGDRLLSCIAEVLLANTRQSDIVGRLGGDEFLLFLPGIQSEGPARKKAEELLHAIRNATGKNPNWAGITASIGIALTPQHGTTFEELYCKADAALYHAKQCGKNQYFIYGNTTCPFFAELTAAGQSGNTPASSPYTSASAGKGHGTKHSSDPNPITEKELHSQP